MCEPDLLLELHIGVHPDGHVEFSTTKLEPADQALLGEILRRVIATLAQWGADQGHPVHGLLGDGGPEVARLRATAGAGPAAAAPATPPRPDP